ncbi:MAG: lytic transglycosylase domain-containing protein [Deltaproteobacteria bacterium]|nr:lytic transglycosylase domain-containing protein [Deltaproteobacteria bacterium]
MHFFSFKSFVLLCIFAVSPVVATEFYQYEVNGKIVYSDTPPQGEKYSVKKTRDTYVVSHTPGASQQSSWRVTPQYPSKYHQYIRTAALKHGVSSRLIHSIIKVESDYDPNAISRKGAQGLMQIMPKTGEMLGLKNAFDPQENIDVGVAYFKKLLVEFDGNTSLALAAYNAGPSNVQKYNGIPPFQETIDYIKKIKNYYSQL